MLQLVHLSPCIRMLRPPHGLTPTLFNGVTPDSRILQQPRRQKHPTLQFLAWLLTPVQSLVQPGGSGYGSGFVAYPGWAGAPVFPTLLLLTCSWFRSGLYRVWQWVQGGGVREKTPPSTEWGAPETEMKREGFPMDWSSLWEDSSAGVPATSADNPPQNPPPQVGWAFLRDAAQRWGLFPGPDCTEWRLREL